MEKIKKEEFKKVITNYLARNSLYELPSKRKNRFIILKAFVLFFNKESYTEKEVNEVIKDIIAKIQSIKVDHVKIRRALVDEGFLDRTASGSIYYKASNEINDLFEDEINEIDVIEVINRAKRERHLYKP